MYTFIVDVDCGQPEVLGVVTPSYAIVLHVYELAILNRKGEMDGWGERERGGR